MAAVKAFFKAKGLAEDSKVFLLLNNCRAHPRGHELVFGNIFAMYTWRKSLCWARSRWEPTYSAMGILLAMLKFSRLNVRLSLFKI